MQGPKGSILEFDGIGSRKRGVRRHKSKIMVRPNQQHRHATKWHIRPHAVDRRDEALRIDGNLRCHAASAVSFTGSFLGLSSTRDLDASFVSSEPFWYIAGLKCPHSHVRLCNRSHYSKGINTNCKTNAGGDIWNAATIVMDCRLCRLLLLLRASFASASRIRGISTARHICQVVEGVEQDSWARG